MTHLKIPSAPGAHRPLVVAGAVRRAWQALPEAARRHVEAFLGPRRRRASGSAVAVAGAEADPLPAVFGDDLARGGARLRAAFPDLQRRLVVLAADPLVLEIECAGTHRGAFYDILAATHRRVRFVERHTLRVDHQRLVEDVLELDLRAIVRQLS